MKPENQFCLLSALTPALSPRERGKHSQFFGEATHPFHRKTENSFCSMPHKFYESIQRLSPLPGGEGQGEGGRYHQTFLEAGLPA